MSEAAPQSGLVVLVPEAEPAVAGHRLVLDANAPLGVPAHVTVLFPFVPPDQIDAGVLSRLGALFARSEPFDYRFARTAWFDDAVLWLAPDDPQPFRALTEAVHEAFPAHPPFGGLFEEVVPHLTIGYGADREALRAAEQAVVACLPIRGRASAVVLLSQGAASGRWTRTAAFPLGSPT
jgi:2'-5' RNA ligase